MGRGTGVTFTPLIALISPWRNCSCRCRYAFAQKTSAALLSIQKEHLLNEDKKNPILYQYFIGGI